MVNEDFKRELKHLFAQSLEEAQVSSENPWTVRETVDEKADQANEFFMLTISSQLFRVIILMHIAKSPDFEQYVMDVLKIGNNVLESDKFYDFVGEVGNAICGSVKRELGKTVPSLGMSTPNRLNKDCLQYIKSQNVDYQAHGEVLINGEQLFAASLYLSADHDLEYDIQRTVPSEDDVASGELEFF